jgi:hypothetical protein
VRRFAGWNDSSGRTGALHSVAPEFGELVEEEDPVVREGSDM